ncbi:ribonuclease HI [Romeria aff. gracilis LEGE 07310]|uniref:Ribonuclease H n=1 Tax=Vasconcelosia minhoensis LEGE 07310 TaxID=915328 RepID=A0A8J7AJQ8_9CYAN|nr:ribonuclease HI [Romeria gracilis]MBE9076635.1 ribonuclease HI [Romeria aff. gracilis LEGE 07310]
MSVVQSIYTDGACSGNPGPGGWGTLIEFDDGEVHELGGSAAKTTNNRMEMQAAIAAMEFIRDAAAPSTVPLYTDSEYLKKGITQWIAGWKRKGWKNSAGKPVLNQDLWMKLDELSQQIAKNQQIQIDWRYVRGHAGNAGNERCDQIARAFSLGQPIRLSTRIVDDSEDHPDSAIAAPAIKAKTVPTIAPDPGVESDNGNDSGDNGLSKERDMAESTAAATDLGRGALEISRMERLRNTLETLQVTDELAKQGYLITSAELADLMDVNASAVTSRGDYWAWRNWTVSRIRREGNQILWQLERIDE